MKNRSVAEGMIIGLRLATLTGGEKADHRKEANGRLVYREAFSVGLCGISNVGIEPRVKG